MTKTWTINTIHSGHINGQMYKKRLVVQNKSSLLLKIILYNT